MEECITKLLSVKSQRPGTEVALPGEDIAIVVKRAREVFLAQPMLLEVCALAVAAVRIVGDAVVVDCAAVVAGASGGVLLLVLLSCWFFVFGVGVKAQNLAGSWKICLRIWGKQL